MEEENIRKIGEIKGVVKIDLFIKFLNKRFPDELDRITSYFEEWADRFNSGSPELYMDRESLRIYEECKQ